jgi:hypothetical protein
LSNKETTTKLTDFLVSYSPNFPLSNATTTATTDVLAVPEELEAIPEVAFPLVNSFTVTFEQPSTYQ